VRTFELQKRGFKVADDEVEGFFEKTVTRFGTGAKIDCPRQFLGRSVYVIVRRAEETSADS